MVLLVGFMIVCSTLFAFAIFAFSVEKAHKLDALRTEPYAPFRKNPVTQVRIEIAPQVTKLMDRWGLSEKDQKGLLGLSLEDKIPLENFRSGESLGIDMDCLGRMDQLLAIAKSLSLICQDNSDQAEKWVTHKNEDMDERPPLEIMMQGYEGLLTVRRYLDAIRDNKKSQHKKAVRIPIPHPFQRQPETRKRVRLGIKVTKLLDQWNLSGADQNILLGLAPNDDTALQNYRSGKGLEEDVDRLGRVGHLLAIGKTLSLIFRKNPDLATRWVMQEDKCMKGRLPLDVMKDGYEGLLAIRRYLDVVRDH